MHWEAVTRGTSRCPQMLLWSNIWDPHECHDRARLEDILVVANKRPPNCWSVSLHGFTCPQSGNTNSIHSELSTSLRSLAIIFIPLHSYHYRILTSRVVMVPTNVPSYNVLYRYIAFYDNRTCNFKYVSHTEFHEILHFDSSWHTIYTPATIEILEALIASAECLGISIEL
jgi:hypothetical protein